MVEEQRGGDEQRERAEEAADDQPQFRQRRQAHVFAGVWHGRDRGTSGRAYGEGGRGVGSETRCVGPRGDGVCLLWHVRACTADLQGIGRDVLELINSPGDCVCSYVKTTVWPERTLITMR